MNLLIGADALHPGADQARAWVEEELSRSAYQLSLWDRFLQWLFGAPTPSGTGGLALAPIAAVLVALLVAVVLALVLRRARLGTGTNDEGIGDVLGFEDLTSGEYRRRALLARDRGDARGAVIDTFRALAAAAIERQDLSPIAGMTADEMASLLGARYAEHSDLPAALRAGAEVFDRTRYGPFLPRAEDVSWMIALDERLEALTSSRALPRMRR